MKIHGVWLPIVTPFLHNQIDFSSYKNLIDHYISKGIHGIIPLGTTGESPTITDKEYQAIIAATVEYVAGRVPIIVGLGGNDTQTLVKKLKMLEQIQVKGILSVCPYYNRPTQNGIYEHFRAVSESTDLDIVIYNIPYRTGTNIENETIYRLAECKNIIGLKDSCGDIKQTMNLLLNRPANFSILTGEDILYYLSLTLGGDGGILASAHVETESFIQLYNNINNNNHQSAFADLQIRGLMAGGLHWN
ncbi:4-hydroxy-tetrahydrodipicolinate synthase [bacterium BFN5]|nr:4-hydroxy-tetrahydrodipicolinate synthase [bacterium BFN5]